MDHNASGKMHAIGVVMLAIGAFVGLFAALLGGSVGGLTYPLWWGGEALLPLAQGAMVILLGAIPFYAVAHLVLVRLKQLPTAGKAFAVGLLVGAALLPGQQLFVVLLRQLPSSENLAPMTAFLLVSLAAGLLAAAIAPFAISVLTRRRHAG